MSELWEKRLDLDFADKSALSKTAYLSVMRKFPGKKWDKWEFLEYLQKLKKQGYSDNYRRFSYYAIKKLYELVEKPWPFEKGRGNLPAVDISEVNTPVMDSESVAKLVSWAKSCGDLRITAVVALSTIYGLRRVEIVGVRDEHIQDDGKENSTLIVQAAKGGEKRTHLIPPEIQAQLFAYRWGEISLSWLSQEFGRICKWTGIDRTSGAGWHSLRRALATELETKAPLMLVWDFLRWKKSALAAAMGMSPMLGTYFHMDPREIDKEIFKVHPFLSLWRTK